MDGSSSRSGLLTGCNGVETFFVSSDHRRVQNGEYHRIDKTPYEEEADDLARSWRDEGSFRPLRFLRVSRHILRIAWKPLPDRCIPQL